MLCHLSCEVVKPAVVAEWVECLCSEREIPHSNPGILPLLSSACRERNGPPCRIHAYTVYTPIGGKGRCHTRHDLRDHRTQARKSAGKRSTPDLKPVRKDTQSPKQEQSVAPQTGPSSNKIKKKKKSCEVVLYHLANRSQFVNIYFIIVVTGQQQVVAFSCWNAYYNTVLTAA